jgi:hypothetical protein
LLIGGGIAITGIGLVSWSRYGNAPAAWVERVVRDNLPGIALDEASLATFVREILSGDLLRPTLHRLAVHVHHAAPWLSARVSKTRHGLEKLERQVLTHFLLGSNFFRVADPKRERIIYYGAAIACNNPFVRR